MTLYIYDYHNFENDIVIFDCEDIKIYKEESTIHIDVIHKAHGIVKDCYTYNYDYYKELMKIAIE